MKLSSRSLVLAFALSCAGLVLSGAGGCAGSGRGAGGDTPATPGGDSAAPTPTPGNPDLVTGSGTVRYLDFEGGFYGIVADDAQRYDPGTLDERFRRDGLRVRFDLRRNPAQMSTRQWGTLVTVVRLDSL